MISPLHRQVLTAVAILGGMGLAFLVSNHVSSGVSKSVSNEIPKSASNDNLNESSRPEAEEGVIEAWLMKRRAYPNKTLPPDDQERMWELSMKAAAPGSFSVNDLTTADHWSNVGPASVIGGQIEGPVVADPNPRVSGRIRDIAVDPNDVANHWFIATETGGVWETTTGGASWTPKTDAQPSLNMKTITIAPSIPQILFATNRDSGRVLKSGDGGATWAIPSSFAYNGSFYFAGLEVHPTHPNIVEAMIYNSIQASAGVFKSTDGGSTWAQKLPGPGTDLAMNPQSFNQQYAALRSQNAGENVSYNGIYRTLDEGNNWTRLTGVNGPWEPMSSGWGARIAIAPSNPNTAYVVVPGGEAGASAGGLWRTDNAWATTPSWTAMPMCVPGAEAVIVDPTDPNTLYIAAGGGENFFRVSGPCVTCPCPGSWVSIQSGTHVDNYALKAAGSTILVGNDGGLWSSSNQGTSWFNKNSNLSTIQFYAGSLHPTRGNWALGGSQDNGTELWNANQAWDFTWYGDGGYNAFAYSPASDPDHRWLVSALVNGNTLYVWKVRVTGGPPYTQYASAANTGLDPTGAAVIAPIKRSPNGDVVLAGADNLFKCTDFFTAADPTWTVNSLEIGSSIAAIAFAPSDPNSLTYAFGTTIGEMRITTQGGVPLRTGWKNLDPFHTLQGRWVTGMAFHPTDPNTIYVTLSGTQAGHIFKTTNALSPSGATWQNVSPPSDVRMNAVAVNPANPNVIFTAADLGVWKSTNGGGAGSWTWMGPDTGMPNVAVPELLFGSDGLLVAFTGGRGAFKLNAGSLQVTLTPPGAVLAGARWSVDGGPPQSSDTILPGLVPGNHIVTFNPAFGYSAPPSQTVTISANQTTQATGVYTSQ